MLDHTIGYHFSSENPGDTGVTEMVMANRPVVEFMQHRRSVLAANLVDPAPDAVALETILAIATRVPDHAKLTPWRIKVLYKEGQQKLADIYRESFIRENPEANDVMVDAAHARLTRSPLLLAVIAAPNMEKAARIPVIEQHLSAGAVCTNILIAAAALGFGAQWLTGGPAYDAPVQAALGLSEHDAIAGFMHIGTPVEPPKERPRPELNDVVETWTG